VVPTGEHEAGFVEVAVDGDTGWVPGEDLSVARAAPRRDPRDYSEAELIRIIEDAADYYAQPRRDMLRVARCESQLTPTAVNRRTGDSGLFQFNPDTWKTTPYARYDIFDPRASAYAAGWMWANGRRGEWVCQ
jgi:soluble lytic murein transglycosylase-like protein